MAKLSAKPVYLVIMIVCLLFQACATTQFSKRDLETEKSCIVVHYRTPDMQVKTLSGVIINLVGGGAIAPALIADHVDDKASDKAAKGILFPDYGDLLCKNFVKSAQEEFPEWPKMTSLDRPVEKGYGTKNGASVLFDVDHMWITLFGGLTIEGDITIKNAVGNKSYGKHFFYRSRDFGIKTKQDEYVANNCKLLIDEIPVAAEHTVKDLIMKELKER